MNNVLNAMPVSAVDVSLIATQYRSNPLHNFFRELNDRISMLHPDVLALLYHYGAYAKGPFLELGPYIGGSTISLARGVADHGRMLKITTVEKGGQHNHPTYPTRDIVESLRANLMRFGVADRINLLIGHSHDSNVLDEIAKVFDRDGEFGCLVIDADGEIEGDLGVYKRFLAPQCYLIIDDYYSPGASEKEEPTRRQVDVLERQGVVESFGVHGWGTWFGRFT